MPYMNWKRAQIGQEIGEHSRGKLLTMSLTRTALDELLPRLEGVFVHHEAELRVDLPEEWVIFWKMRDSESRLLIAHPQEKEWVTTVALDAPHGLKLLGLLKDLESGGSVTIGELSSVGNVSNVEVILKVI
jgi:hypothetical protein